MAVKKCLLLRHVETTFGDGKPSERQIRRVSYPIQSSEYYIC